MPAAGVAALSVGLGGAEIALVGLGAFVTFLGVAVLGPVLARPVTRCSAGRCAIGRPRRRWPPATPMRNPKRTARTASALMIGVALVAFIAVFGASVKSSFGGALEDDFRGTHVIDSRRVRRPRRRQPRAGRPLRSTPGVETVDRGPHRPGGRRWRRGHLSTPSMPPPSATLFDLGNVQGDLAAWAPTASPSRTTAPVTGLDPRHHGAVDPARRGARRSWSGPSTTTATAGSATTFVDTEAFDRYLPDQLDYRVYVAGDDAAVRAAAAAAYPSVEVLDRGSSSPRSPARSTRCWASSTPCWPWPW